MSTLSGLGRRTPRGAAAYRPTPKRPGHLSRVRAVNQRGTDTSYVVHTDESSMLGDGYNTVVAVIAEAVEVIATEGTTHPPVELLSTVDEDAAPLIHEALDVVPVELNTEPSCWMSNKAWRTEQS